MKILMKLMVVLSMMFAFTTLILAFAMVDEDFFLAIESFESIMIDKDDLSLWILMVFILMLEHY